MGKATFGGAVVLCAIAAALTAFAAPAEEPFFESGPVFAFDAARLQNHASSIAEMPNGDLLVTWFGGSKEGMPDAAVWSSRRVAGSKKWSDPVKIIDDPKFAEGNSVLFTDSKGKVRLFYVVKFEERWDAWEAGKIYLRTSDDAGFSWSEPRVLIDKTGWMIRNNVIELPGGKLLLPVYTENPKQSIAWISGDGFRTWEEYKVPLTDPGNYQPAMAYAGGTKIVMAARYGGNPGHVWMSISDDLGKTWRDPKKMKMKNPDSGISLIALKSGALVLAYNDNPWVRTPLCVALSEDGGRSWPHKRTLETASAEFSYPFLIQDKNSHIHLTYTSNNRKLIKHAEFNELWLKNTK